MQYYLNNTTVKKIICIKFIKTDIKCDILKYFSFPLSLNLFIKGINKKLDIKNKIQTDNIK